MKNLLLEQLLQLLQELQLLQGLQQESIFLLFCNTSKSKSRKFVLLAKSTSPFSSTGLVSIDNSRINNTSLLKFIFSPTKSSFYLICYKILFC